MKKMIAFFIAIMIPFIASAETIDELMRQREVLLIELSEVNEKIAQIKKAAIPSGSLGRICDLFPDEVLATIIRDNCAKFSIEQSITREELEKISSINFSDVWKGYGEVCDLTGIGLLVNLKWVSGEYCGVHELPEEFRNCIHLQSLNMGYSDLEILPEWIGDFSELNSLNITETNISKIPETIGNLKNLKHLFIGGTKVTELPNSIYNLQLESLNMKGLPIK
ncbi:MAG: hypothetical protein IJP78_12405 [Clostridia bacterium]|nr:hypothetical protein [Clostridia bacterium]